MIDPVNPTLDEIVAWAFQPGAMEPMQDWDLILEGQEAHFATHVKLAGDGNCPPRGYFLAVLYLLVGDAVRGGIRQPFRGWWPRPPTPPTPI